MTREGPGVTRSSSTGAERVDDVDRKLLELLGADANRSYSELGEIVHLSAAAVHERVKRLKQSGVIMGTAAILNGAKLGRPLLAFIHVNTKLWDRDHQLLKLGELPDVEEMHTITGESAMLLKVRTRDAQSLEELLVRIYKIEGIEGTRSQIVLSTYLERGPSPLVG